VGAFKLVELRNPWGNDREWNGDWSDKVPFSFSLNNVWYLLLLFFPSSRISGLIFHM
jgi:hypothetical protein